MVINSHERLLLFTKLSVRSKAIQNQAFGQVSLKIDSCKYNSFERDSYIFSYSDSKIL